MTEVNEVELPDPGHCACGMRGSWRRPMYGKVGDFLAVWPTCRFHPEQATGPAVYADEYEAVYGDGD